MASRATLTPGIENVLSRLVSSRLNARTASTNEVRSVNPNTNAFARNVVKITACAKDSTAKTPPTVNAKTSHIGLIQGGSKEEPYVAPDRVAASTASTASTPKNIESAFLSRRNMETATTPLMNTAKACARRSLALFPTIRRRSFAGVSTPSAAKSRAMTRAADASMCTPSAVSNARVASKSDIDGGMSSSSETSSSSSSSSSPSSSSPSVAIIVVRDVVAGERTGRSLKY